MAIFVIDTGIKQFEMIHDIYKYFIIFILMHFFTNLLDITSYGFFESGLFNVNFIAFLALIVITFLSYNLIVKELIEVK